MGHPACEAGGDDAKVSLGHPPDWLGTVRVRTNPAGAVSNYMYSNLPFGDCLDQTGGAQCDNQVGSTPTHFTDQDRDSETNLDHFMFRQYSSLQGRWITPDPAGLAAVDLINPQTWNRYTYALNNAVNFIDPLGLRCKKGGFIPIRKTVQVCSSVSRSGDGEATYCYGSEAELIVGYENEDEGECGGGQDDKDKDKKQLTPPAPPSPPNNCGDLLAEMRNLVDAVRTSRSDPKGLAQRFGQILRGSETNNVMEFQNRQRQLQTKINDYRNSGCGEPPADVSAWATLPAASPWSPPTLQNFNVPRWVVPAVIITGGVAVAVFAPEFFPVYAAVVP